jgi:outer membrane protein
MFRVLLPVALAAVLVSPAASVAQPPPSPRPPVAGRVLPLAEALDIALAGQPNIQARLFDYAAARYRVDQALSPLLPQLAGSVSATRSQNVFITTSTTTGLTTQITAERTFDQTFLAQVTLSQLLFDFGKTWSSAEAARKLANVAFEDIELQRQLITLAVKQAYTNINFAQRLIRVQEQAAARAELNLRSATGFFEVGTRPKSDVTRAEVDVANARLDLIRARNSEKLARVALNTALGIAVDTPTQVEDNLVFEPITLDPPSLRAEAIRQRPESKQVRLQVEVADAQLRRSQRDFLPDISGNASYGGATTDLLPAWSFTLNFSWSLFDGGNRIGRYREAKANREASEARVRASDLDIAQQVEQAQLTVTETEERIQAAQVAVTSALENFRLAQGRFDAGVGTILELTDAQLALTQAQNTEAQALADFRNALAQLDRAVGRR